VQNMLRLNVRLSECLSVRVYPYVFQHTEGDNMVVLDSDQMDKASAVSTLKTPGYQLTLYYDTY
jgi:hypothetical protein